MSFLDCNGILIPAVAEQWTDFAREQGRDGKKAYNSKFVARHKYKNLFIHMHTRKTLFAFENG